MSFLMHIYQCPTTTAPTADVRTPTSASVCPQGVREVQCLVDPCANAKCSAFPDATCKANACGIFIL